MMGRSLAVLCCLSMMLVVISGCLKNDGDGGSSSNDFMLGEWSIKDGSESYVVKFKVDEDGRCNTFIKNGNMWDSGWYIGKVQNGSKVIMYSKTEIRVCQTDSMGEVIAQTMISTNETWVFDGDSLIGRRVVKESVDFGNEENFEPDFYARLPSTETSSWTGVRTSKAPV